MKETYKPYTLVELTVTRPVQDPLPVLLFDNRLYIHQGLECAASKCWSKYTTKEKSFLQFSISYAYPTIVFVFMQYYGAKRTK